MSSRLVEEFWSDIWDIEGYQVSNYGRVRNAKTGRILKPYLNRPGGYLRVDICGKHYYVARLVAGTFINRHIDNYKITYENGDRSDCSLPNLSLVPTRDEYFYDENYNYDDDFDDF